MVTPVRAVYEQGHLRLLQPLDLLEGQEIDVLILTEREQAIAALGDLVAATTPLSAEDIDEEALLKELDETYGGNLSVSDAIIQERREGP
jgi:predicted DNA-binding antitoxin AbrB/MazE fold protein